MNLIWNGLFVVYKCNFFWSLLMEKMFRLILKEEKKKNNERKRLNLYYGYGGQGKVVHCSWTQKKVFDVMDKACEKWNENVSTMHPISTHSCSVLIRRSTDKIEKGWNYIWFASHTWLLATINLWRSMLGVGVSLGGAIRRHIQCMCVIQCIIFQYATLAFWR